MKKLIAVLAAACLLGCPPAEKADPAAAPAPAESSDDPAETADAPADDGEPWTEIADGLKYIELQVGDGPEVKPGDTVLTHATGTFPDGKKFWSSLDKGKKIAFPLKNGSVITGWVKGVPGMKVGGKRKLFVPWKLAYGLSGRAPTIPPKADLVFEIEVFEIQ